MPPPLLSDATTALANRLYDPQMVHWPQIELVTYIQEALQTWNAFASYWRGDFTFTTVVNKPWYDLTAQTGTLRPLTATDTNLYATMAAQFLESFLATYPLTWSGTLQFTMQGFIAAVQRGRDETLGVTGCSITLSTIPATVGRISLSNSVIDIRRLAYTDLQGNVTYLWKSDQQTWVGYEPLFTSNPSGTPQTYSTNSEPVWSFDVDVPVNPGSYELLTVNSGPVLTAASPSKLVVPDDWTWIIKFRAEAELLGQSNEPGDVMRAEYCEMRYRQGLKLLSLAPALLAVRVNNVPTFIDSVQSADAYQVGWESKTPGTPAVALCAGLNLIALSPPPDGAYTITATVVENAPLPVNPTDQIGLSGDLYDVILDYAQHLAAFKMGGEEFKATMPLYERFVQQATLYSAKLGAQGPFQRELYAMSHKQEMSVPRLKETEEVA